MPCAVDICRYDKPVVGRSFGAKKENESMSAAGGVIWYLFLILRGTVKLFAKTVIEADAML